MVWMVLGSTVFDDVCHYFADVEAGGTDLLRDETGGGHTGGGIDLEEIDDVALGDDVVDADNAVAAEDVVDGAGKRLDALGETVADTGGGYLVDLSVVLGIVVEEFVSGDDLGYGEYVTDGLGLVAAAGYLGALHIGFDHDVFAFAEG